MDLSGMLAFAVSGERTPKTLRITLMLAPRIYEDERPATNDLLLEMLVDLYLGPQRIRRFRDNKTPGLDPAIVAAA